jgi:hypothetical protein
MCLVQQFIPVYEYPVYSSSDLESDSDEESTHSETTTPPASTTPTRGDDEAKAMSINDEMLEALKWMTMWVKIAKWRHRFGWMPWMDGLE